MQTIILTDNKRLSTDYYADKTLFAEKIDVNHILNTQVYQSHISRARFWTIRTNIHNEENLVHQLCKNLVNRGSSSIRFELNITKICSSHEAPQLDEKRLCPTNERYNRLSIVSNYCQSNPMKAFSFPHFQNTAKPLSHVKTISSVEWTVNNELIKGEQRKTHEREACSTPKNNGQEVVTLKLLLKKEFEVSSLSELSAVFMTKEGIFSEFGLSEEVVMKSKRLITTYIFRQNEIQIGLSVVSQGCKKFIQKAINIEISQAFNAHFNSRKQAYESTCLNENFSQSNASKSTTKLTSQIPKQTYHKILLFLFTYYDLETQKTKVSSSNLSQPNASKETSKYIQAIQQWKMKDQDINIAEKLSKEYVLIKQQVQNQKVNFRNKLKIFQAIIGESVNVDKLLNEQKQMQTNSNIKTSENQQNNNNHKTNQMQNSRISRKSQLKSMLSSPQQMNTTTNSEFKRLKESFEMIRNIDNVINQQNKKIQTLKLYQKEIIKSKNQMLYKSVKALNQLKKQIREIKDEIQQKKVQNQFKVQKLQKEKNGKKRNYLPTNEAQDLLKSNVNIFKQIIQNEKANKDNEKYVIEDEKQRIDKQNNQRLSHNINDSKKGFFIRKQTASFTHIKNTLALQLTLQETIKKQKQSYQSPVNPVKILTTLYKSQQQKQTKLRKRRRQQIQNNNIWHNLQMQQNKKSYFEQKNQQMSSIKEKQVLLELYDYFIKNNDLLKRVNKQLSAHHTIDSQIIGMNYKNPLRNSQMLGFKARNIHTSLYNNRFSEQASTSQLNLSKNCSFYDQNSTMWKKTIKDKFEIECAQIDLQKFPLLDEILHPKRPPSVVESEECSIISDTDSIDNQKQEGNENRKELITEMRNKKRVTIQNLVQKA